MEFVEQVRLMQKFSNAIKEMNPGFEKTDHIDKGFLPLKSL